MLAVCLVDSVCCTQWRERLEGTGVTRIRQYLQMGNETKRLRPAMTAFMIFVAQTAPSVRMWLVL